MKRFVLLLLLYLPMAMAANVYIDAPLEVGTTFNVTVWHDDSKTYPFCTVSLDDAFSEDYFSLAPEETRNVTITTDEGIHDVVVACGTENKSEDILVDVIEVLVSTESTQVDDNTSLNNTIIDVVENDTSAHQTNENDTNVNIENDSLSNNAENAAGNVIENSAVNTQENALVTNNVEKPSPVENLSPQEGNFIQNFMQKYSITYIMLGAVFLVIMIMVVVIIFSLEKHEHVIKPAHVSLKNIEQETMNKEPIEGLTEQDRMAVLGFIERERWKGFDDMTIRDALINNGWEQTIVDRVFDDIYKKVKT